MPIHINLLAEAQIAEELRRHDPVKRAVFIGASLVLLALMWSGVLEISVFLAKESYSGVQATIKARTNLYQQAMVEQGKIDANKAKLAALEKLQAARFLQGNLLNALQQSTVDGVQLTRVRVEQAYFLSEGQNASTVKERIVLRLGAKDSSANPGDQISKFMTNIVKQPYFAAALSKTNSVQLTGPPTSPAVDSGKPPYVTFELECRYPDHIR